MSIEIAPIDYANPAHRDAVVPLLESYAGTPQSCGRGMTQAARDSVVDTLAAMPTAMVLIAWRGTIPVGMAVCFELFTTFKAQPVVNLHDLVVAPDCRGQGIGGRLLQAVEQAARQRGAYSITLEVAGVNQHAKHLYRKAGYEGGETIEPAECELFWRKTL